MGVRRSHKSPRWKSRAFFGAPSMGALFFAHYADDANVYVRSRRAGERVMALLRRLYGRLGLKVNETKSAVASVFGRQFLGYSLRVAAGGVVKRKVAAKPLLAFRHRIRELTRRAGGRSMKRTWWNSYGPTCRVGERPSGWRKHPVCGWHWMSGCVTGCELSSLNTGAWQDHLPGTACARRVGRCGATGGGERSPLVAQQRQVAQRARGHQKRCIVPAGS
jgi:hypothetical protein